MIIKRIEIREIIRIAAFVALILVIFSCQQRKEPQNILFISVDDLRTELGVYGNEIIQTPNLDALATEGALFTNHFVQVPTCGASRYGLLTGRLPSTRAHLSNNIIESEIANSPEQQTPESFVHHLKRNGYYTVGIGKISHSADGMVYGYNEQTSSKRELPYSWDERLFNAGKWGTGWNAFFGYANGENRQSLKKLVKPYEAGEVNEEGYPDGLTANLAIEKLMELKNKKQPFFLGVGFFKPHLPFTAPKKYWDLYDESTIPLAPFDSLPSMGSPLSLHGSGEFNQYQLGEEKASLNHPVSDAYARKLRHAYFACVSYIDEQVGKIMEQLETLGLAENTIVVVWGDHGWHLGDHSVWGKHTLFDRALKSTFIIKNPKYKAGQRVEQVVSTIDIYPTILEMLNLEQEMTLDGSSLVTILKNPKNQVKDKVSYSYFKNGISMRTKHYRFTRYFRKNGIEMELYDLNSDPNETRNIAEQHPNLIRELLPLWEKGNTGLFRK